MSVGQTQSGTPLPDRGGGDFAPELRNAGATIIFRPSEGEGALSLQLTSEMVDSCPPSKNTFECRMGWWTKLTA
jgi:hypothetical protein